MGLWYREGSTFESVLEDGGESASKEHRGEADGHHSRHTDDQVTKREGYSSELVNRKERLQDEIGRLHISTVLADLEDGIDEREAEPLENGGESPEEDQPEGKLGLIAGDVSERIELLAPDDVALSP